MTGDGPRPLPNNRGKRSIPSGGVYDARHFVSRLSLIAGLGRPFPISSPPSLSLGLSHSAEQSEWASQTYSNPPARRSLAGIKRPSRIWDRCRRILTRRKQEHFPSPT
jgi:hypothetical protein